MGLVLYNIPTGPCFSRNPIRYKVGTDKDLETVGLYIEALVEFMGINSTTYTEVIRYPLTPDNIGIVEIDLSRIANRLLTYATPSTENSLVKDAASQTGKLRVTFTEYDFEGDDDIIVTDEILIVKGGIAHERFQVNTFWQNRFNDFKLLTWMPRTRSMRTWVNDYVSYMHKEEDVLGALVEVRLTYTDESTDTFTLFFPGNTAKENHVYHIPCGYKNLALDTVDPSKKVWYYTVQVMDGTTPLSELQTFEMNYDPAYETFYLSYFNSLGGFESIPILGEHTLNISRDYDLININTSRSNYNGMTVPAMSRMNRVTEETSYKANIGVIDEWELHDLRRELFLSEEIYTIRNNRWWPVNVLDKSMDFGPINAQIKEVPIEWSYAFSNTQYTPAAIAFW
jgi:hypothetical protein